LRKFFEVTGHQTFLGPEDYYKTDVHLIKPKSKSHERYTVLVEGEAVVSFTDVQEAMSQVESIRVFGGFKAEVVRA
jgi:hypothetical protein